MGKWFLGIGTTIIGGVSVALIVNVLTPPSHETAAPKRTAVRLVRVFSDTGSLLPAYHVEQTLTGGKCTESNVSSDPSALRCYSGNDVVDPCWQDSSNGVACLRDPWSPAVLYINDVTTESGSAAPNATATAGPPWALEIEDPAHANHLLDCIFTGGSGGTVARMRINWHCRKPDQSWAQAVGDAIGDIQVFDDRPWIVFYSATDSGQVVETNVDTVWR